MSRRSPRDRRTGIVAGGRKIVSLFDQVLTLAQGRPFFTADYYAVDGVSGKVLGFVDWNDPSHMLLQASSAAQVALPVASASFGGKLVAAFAGVERYISTRTPAQWAFAHGTDVESVRGFSASSTGLAGVRVPDLTCTSGATGRGYQTYLNNGAVTFDVVSDPLVHRVPTTTLGTAAADTPIAQRYTLTSAGWACQMLGRAALSGAYAAASGSDPNPDSPLILGSRIASGDSLFHGAWALLAFFPVLTPEQRLLVETWLHEVYGFPKSAGMLFEEVLTLAAGRPVFTADNCAEVGGKVIAFIDWNDPTHVLQQASASLQVATPAPSAGFAGALVAPFLGGQVYASNRAALDWAFLNGAAPVQVVHIFEATATAPSNAYLAATDAGATGYAMICATATSPYLLVRNAGTLNKFHPYIPFALNTPSYHQHRLNVGSGFEIKVKSAVVEAAPWDTAPTGAVPGTALLIGASNAAAVQGMPMSWAGTLCFPALSAAQESTVQQWIQAAYGIAP